MGKNISIPAGVRDTGVTLQSALVYSSLLDNFVKGKGGIVKVKDMADAGNMTDDQVRQEVLSLSKQSMLSVQPKDFIPRGYRVSSVTIAVEPCLKEDEEDDDQEEMDFGAEDESGPSRYATGEETFKIGEAEFIANVFPSEAAYGLTIKRTADGAIVAETAAADQIDAWRWIDEWAKGDGPKAEPKPNPLEWLANAKKNGIIQEDEIKLAPTSFWATVDALGIDRKFAEAENPPFVTFLIEEDGDDELKVILGEANDLVIDGYEEPEEPSLFDATAEPDPTPMPAKE